MMSAVGYCIVCYNDALSETPHVASYSGGSGDVYSTREEAEDFLFYIRVEMRQHRPDDRYELAELHVITVKEGEERRARPGDAFYEEPVHE